MKREGDVVQWETDTLKKIRDCALEGTKGDKGLWKRTFDDGCLEEGTGIWKIWWRLRGYGDFNALELWPLLPLAFIELRDMLRMIIF